MELTVHGAGQTVTGSLFQITTKTTSFLLDCGLFQGSSEGQYQRNHLFSFNPKGIDFVILTHAHLDHCGRLPMLVKAGFRGPIYTTSASAELCTLLLRDVGESEEEEATRHHSKQGSPQDTRQATPLFTVQDAERAIRQLKAVEYNRKLTLTGNVILRFRDAGHILGSSIVETWIEEDNRIVHLVDTGDIGRRNAPIIRDPDFPSTAPYLLCESTYANRTHEALKRTIKHFERIIIKANRHQSHILVPAFAIGRTQALIYALNTLVEKGRVPIIPVAIDSPLAIRATEIFKRHRECFDDETWDLIESGDAPLDFKGLQYVERHNDSDMLSQQRGPMMIIAGSGMMSGGRILRHLYRRIEDHNTHLLVIGFQAPGTLGHRIVHGARQVRIYGRPKRVRARIERLYGFSAHADKNELMGFFSSLRNQPPHKVFAVHGSPKACQGLVRIVKHTLRCPAIAPKNGEKVRL
ncbi:MAG: MBL fold metallo-hydrolase RNA specificity domain-containing protein [Candidatus Hodarchaeota archaeon]